MITSIKVQVRGSVEHQLELLCGEYQVDRGAFLETCLSFVNIMLVGNPDKLPSRDSSANLSAHAIVDDLGEIIYPYLKLIPSIHQTALLLEDARLQVRQAALNIEAMLPHRRAKLGTPSKRGLDHLPDPTSYRQGASIRPQDMEAVGELLPKFAAILHQAQDGLIPNRVIDFAQEGEAHLDWIVSMATLLQWLPWLRHYQLIRPELELDNLTDHNELEVAQAYGFLFGQFIEACVTMFQVSSKLPMENLRQDMLLCLERGREIKERLEKVLLEIDRSLQSLRFNVNISLLYVQILGSGVRAYTSIYGDSGGRPARRSKLTLEQLQQLKARFS